jgi:hypothetical protein
MRRRLPDVLIIAYISLPLIMFWQQTGGKTLLRRKTYTSGGFAACREQLGVPNPIMRWSRPRAGKFPVEVVYPLI